MDYILKLADENGLMKQKNKASFSEYFKVFLSTCKITQTSVITQMSVISQMSVILLKTSNWTITITITMTINMTVTMTLKERHHKPKRMFFLTNCGIRVESNPYMYKFI